MSDDDSLNLRDWFVNDVIAFTVLHSHSPLFSTQSDDLVSRLREIGIGENWVDHQKGGVVESLIVNFLDPPALTMMWTRSKNLELFTL